jgi:hypothetical protein
MQPVVHAQRAATMMQVSFHQKEHFSVRVLFIESPSLESMLSLKTLSHTL